VSNGSTRPAGPLAAVGIAILCLYVAGAIFVNVVGNAIGKGLEAAFSPTGKGVVVTSCRADPDGRVDIRGTAHNETSSQSYFGIGLVVSNRIGTRRAAPMVALRRVLPGRTVRWRVRARARFAPGTTCALESVFRVPLP
jgi:hypothetical protein